MQQLYVYTDGGARGNPGPAAIGVVIYFKKASDKPFEKIHAVGKKIGTTTNNVAEYQAVIEAWKWIIENKKKFSDDLSIDFFLDSFIVVNQLLGRYKLKGPKFTDLIFTIKGLQQQIKAKIDYHYIGREMNTEADYWVNKALDEI